MDKIFTVLLIENGIVKSSAHCREINKTNAIPTYPYYQSGDDTNPYAYAKRWVDEKPQREMFELAEVVYDTDGIYINKKKLVGGQIVDMTQVEMDAISDAIEATNKDVEKQKLLDLLDDPDVKDKIKKIK